MGNLAGLNWPWGVGVDLAPSAGPDYVDFDMLQWEMEPTLIGAREHGPCRENHREHAPRRPRPKRVPPPAVVAPPPDVPEAPPPVIPPLERAMLARIQEAAQAAQCAQSIDGIHFRHVQDDCATFEMKLRQGHRYRAPNGDEFAWLTFHSAADGLDAWFVLVASGVTGG